MYGFVIETRQDNHNGKNKLMFKKEDFKRKVLEVVKKIPRGKVLSYKQVAAKAGNFRAARAVGMIMKNNHDKNVPCHRVILSSGKLGGYNGNLGEKRALLRAEGYFKQKFLISNY